MAVVGGTEFIGRRLVESLVGRGDDVLVVHRGVTEPTGWVACEHAHVERRDIQAVTRAITRFGADAVVDSCAMTREDVEPLVSQLPDVPRVVLSSQDVYRAYELVLAGEEGEPLPVDESGALRNGRYPNRGRGWGCDDYDKIHVEEGYLGHGGVVLRLPRTYGEFDAQRREEPLLRRIRAGRRRIPVGAANWMWTRGYVGEVARSVLAVLDHPELAGEAFNIGESTTRSYLGWAKSVVAATGSDAEFVVVPEGQLPGDLDAFGTHAQHLVTSSEKAARLLGWRHADGEACIRRSVRWHLDNPPQTTDDDFSADDRALAG